MKFKVYFKHSDGTPDEIVISGDTIEEIKEKKNKEMIARNKSYLWQEFSRNNLPRYYKYFESWVNTLTYAQVLYFTAYMLGQKTCLNFCSLELCKH